MDDNKIIDFNKAKKEASSLSIESKDENTEKESKNVKNSSIIDINEKENQKIKEKVLKENAKKEKLKEDENKKKQRKEIAKEVSLDILEPKAPVNTKAKNIVFNVFLCVMAFVLFLIMFINMPIFTVRDIRITGNTSVTSEQIKETIGFNENKNFLFLYFKPLEEMILKNPMIKNVEVRYAFPNQITIKIEEIIISGYIPYLDEYVYIDSTGKVVNISNEIIPNVPLIKGLNFTSFSIGNVLDVTNKETLDIIVELANIINKYMLNTNVAIIDIMQTDDIRIIYKKNEIILGSMEDCDYKIRKAIEIIKKLPNAYGYLDVSSTSNRSVFAFK